MVRRFRLGDLTIDVVQKDIKNIHLSVNPPTGRVRISAPLRTSLETLRVFTITKLGWIRQQRSRLLAQQRESPRQYIERESHYVWGRRYLLSVKERDQPPSIALRPRLLILSIRPGTGPARRRIIMDEWYREQIKTALDPLLAKWQAQLGVEVNRIFVQRMKTKWGSCNPTRRNIRLNTDLAKKPPQCLEYILVHEMAHLLIRRHDQHFTALLDRVLPHWRTDRAVLNASPLSHEDWLY